MCVWANCNLVWLYWNFLESAMKLDYYLCLWKEGVIVFVVSFSFSFSLCFIFFLNRCLTQFKTLKRTLFNFILWIVFTKTYKSFVKTKIIQPPILCFCHLRSKFQNLFFIWFWKKQARYETDVYIFNGPKVSRKFKQEFCSLL